jgi:hypothetical protein
MPLGTGYRATRVFDSGWMEYFGGQGMYNFYYRLMLHLQFNKQ